MPTSPFAALTAAIGTGPGPAIDLNGKLQSIQITGTSTSDFDLTSNMFVNIEKSESSSGPWDTVGSNPGINLNSSGAEERNSAVYTGFFQFVRVNCTLSTRTSGSISVNLYFGNGG